MSDLIRKSDVIKLINCFAFSLYKEQDDKIKKVFKEYVEKMPAAYDIDNVIEELNELDVKSITRYKNGNFGNFDGVEYYIKKRKAIEIVKHGGMAESEQKLKEMESGNNGTME